MRRYYDDNRRTFVATFILYQCVTTSVAFIVGTMGWNVATMIRATILSMLVLAFLVGKRRFDWIAALVILAVIVLRLTTQAVR